MEIKMKITKKFKDPLSRQANEGVRISNRRKIELMNSKTEFNHPPIARITVEKQKGTKKKSPQNYDRSKSEFGRALQKTSGSLLHSGTEHSLINSSENNINQKQFSSDQEN